MSMYRKVLCALLSEVAHGVPSVIMKNYHATSRNYKRYCKTVNCKVAKPAFIEFKNRHILRINSKNKTSIKTFIYLFAVYNSVT